MIHPALVLAILSLWIGAHARQGLAQEAVQEPADARSIGADDMWIASLGDSFSSGEGNPEILGMPLNAGKWMDRERCNRSRAAWPYVVAEIAAQQYRRTIYLSFLACSGAMLKQGLLEPYTESPPALGPVARKAQLDRLQDLIEAAGRPPNVVLLTGGGNDIGFSDIVLECLTAAPNRCPGGSATSPGVLNAGFNALTGGPDLYGQVADRLERMGVSADRVVFLEYPNPLWGRRRVGLTSNWQDPEVLSFCWAQGRVQGQWEWAHENVVRRLQRAQQDAAAREGWVYVDGYGPEFEKHSYCPREGLLGNDSWWVGLVEEVLRQWGIGAFHPNRRGHREMAGEAFAAAGPAFRRAVTATPVAADFGRPETGDAFGGGVAIGDFDGDGKRDLAVGAPGEARGSAPRNSGVVFVYRGNGMGSLTSWVILDQEGHGQIEAEDRFGAAVAAGDFDGDGIDDLAVGSPGEAPGSAPSAGYVNLFRGTRNGLRPWGGFHQEGLGQNERGDQFGAALSARDLNGDGKDDLLVGAPGEAVGRVAGTGHVFVFRGTASGLQPWKTIGQGEAGS